MIPAPDDDQILAAARHRYLSAGTETQVSSAEEGTPTLCRHRPDSPIAGFRLDPITLRHMRTLGPYLANPILAQHFQAFRIHDEQFPVPWSGSASDQNQAVIPGLSCGDFDAVFPERGSGKTEAGRLGQRYSTRGDEGGFRQALAWIAGAGTVSAGGKEGGKRIQGIRRTGTAPLEASVQPVRSRVSSSSGVAVSTHRS
jgi:hypothetical protein